jgi:multiple sugar transport system substrate-binding protein
LVPNQNERGHGLAELTGITWDHPRGLGPLLAATSAYTSQHTDVSVRWEARTLQDFADVPIDDLAKVYDLVIIDHPHVGEVAATKCLVPLDEVVDHNDMARLAEQSVGSSHDSYGIDSHQWALAVDAAAQVSAYRQDCTGGPPTAWDQVLERARAGEVLWPYKPVDALMSFFTLTANLGHPCFVEGELPIPKAAGREVLEYMFRLAQLVPEGCASMNPIAALEAMASNGQLRYCPLLFGYSNYSRPGFRPALVRFTNIPSWSSSPVGSVLGGAGIGVSSKCLSIGVASRFATWLASAECQRTVYFEGGGQPANAEAWADLSVNQGSSEFFRSTRDTLERSWMRPRFRGFLRFQKLGGMIVHEFLLGKYDSGQATDLLEQTYLSVRADAR